MVYNNICNNLELKILWVIILINEIKYKSLNSKSIIT